MKKKLTTMLAVSILSITSIFAAYPKVALVLSGGGAKGFAQVAAIQEIQELGIPIDFICGTSIGALVGGYIAAGYSADELLYLLRTNDLASMLYTSTSSSYPDTPYVFENNIESNFTIGFNKNGIGDVPGLIGDQEIQEFFSKTLIKESKPLDFKDLEIPFKAVATNATNNEQIVIDSGLVQDAMRASMSLPLVFPPYVLLDGRYTMDGGMNNNFPIDVAERWGADIIIGIDVSSDNLKKEGEYSTLTGALNQVINLVTFTGNIDAESRCDVLLRPVVYDFSVLDMDKEEEILQRGYDEFRAHKDELIALKKRIARTRDLTPYEIEGSYLKRPDPIVKEVKVVDVSGSNENLSLVRVFDKFVGKTLTDTVMKQLDSEIEGFNKINSISTTSYSFTPYDDGDDVNDGILYLYVRDWEDSESQISLNVDANFGLSNDSSNYSWAHTNFELSVLFDDILGTNFDNHVSISVDDSTEIYDTIIYNIISQKNNLLNGSLKFGLATGGLSPVNSSYMKYHISTFAFSAMVDIGAEYRYSNHFRVETGLDYTLSLLSSSTLPTELIDVLTGGESSGEQISYTDPIVSEILFKAGAVYNDKDPTLFSTEGLYAKGAGMLVNTNGEFGYGTEISLRYSKPISDNETLKLNFDFNMNTRNEELMTSYYDIGGYTGMIGYPVSTYRRGYMLAEISYQRSLGKYIFPLYFQTGLKILTYDDYDPSENLYDSGANRFMKSDDSSVNPLDEGDVGVYIGLGAPLGAGTALVGVGVTYKGKTSLVLEFI